MLVICRVYEDRQQHRKLPAVVKPRVWCILKDDGRYKNISRSNHRNQQRQQYQTHHQTSKLHITIRVNIFSNHRGLFIRSRETENTILLNPDTVREAHSYPIAFLFTLVRPSSVLVQERKYTLPGNSRNEWQIEIWVTTILAHNCTRPFAFYSPYFLSSVIVQERKLYTPLYPLPGNSRNEWQIEIWVTNHFKILCAYYTWSLSWTTYYLNIHNNPFGEKNSSTSSIALDVPSSISTNVLCIFALTIIPTSFLILLLYTRYPDLSNTTMMMREKRILIWLLINYLIKLTN